MSGEISRQIISSQAKMVFTLIENCKTIQMARELSKHDFQIVTLKTDNSQCNVNGTIDFTELMNTKGILKSLIYKV